MNQKKIIFEWLAVNLAGWIIFASLLNFVFPLFEPDPTKASFFIGITFIGLLLGTSIGIMQWLWLNAKKQHIQPFWWILETACGWGSVGLMFFFWMLLDCIPVYSMIFLMFVGFILGLVQALILRKPIGTSISWIVANVLGIFIFGLSAYGLLFILFIPIIYQSFFQNVLNSIYSHLNFYLPPKGLYFSYLMIVSLIMPILGAVTTALPTGFVIYKRFNSSMSGKMS